MRPIKIITVVGARPQFIKAAVLSRAFVQLNNNQPDLVREIIVHTGQHYDTNMSEVFFRQLDIPEPEYNLEIGSASHGAQTGRMLEKLEELLLKESPDVVLVYGDTNSTLAGALAAAKLHVPVAHVEAGLRSFNKQMPEEINRILTDHVSHWLYCPTTQSVTNLENEGIRDGVFNVGDIMHDSMLFYRDKIARKPNALKRLGLAPKAYLLATVHRAENTDSIAHLRQIFSAFGEISAKYPVIVALHPRTRKFIEKYQMDVTPGVHLLEPLSYLEMIELETHARVIMTDSGGVQKEAFFVATPCLTLREETEWVETVSCGANRLCGASAERILAGFGAFEADGSAGDFAGAPYGDGKSAAKIVDRLLEVLL